ncbi:MAG TPA: hemerythrin domain-containing protein [Burkholderiales bacterium]
MDAIDLLVRQHREMETAMKEVLGATDDAAVKALFAQVADQLTMHITSEEQVFYPAVKAQRTEDILLESLEEHLSLKRLLADLLDLDPGHQTFEPKFKVLKEQTEHHHQEEEEHLFPKVANLLDESQRAALGAELLALQRHLDNAGEPREAVVNQTEEAAPLG